MVIREDDENSSDTIRPDMDPKTQVVDPWDKYKKVRRVGRIDSPLPTNFVSQNGQRGKITYKNHQNQPSIHNASRLFRQSQEKAVQISRVSSANEIHSINQSKDVPSNVCVVKDDSDKILDICVPNNTTHTGNDYAHNGYVIKETGESDETCPREKKHSITVSIHDEIRKSFTRTRTMSITMIKSIFKKSKTFHSSSDTLISSSRNASAADAIIPNFIFKYHTEDVEDPLPQSDQTGWVRQCWSAFAMGLNTLVCGILLGLMFFNQPMLPLSSPMQQTVLLTWLQYAFVSGSFISCLFLWQTINYFGRRVTNIICTFMLLISLSLFLFQSDCTSLVIGFIFAGLSCSGGFVNSYFYLPECVEEKMFIPTSFIFSSMLFLGMFVTNLVLMVSTLKCLFYVSITLLLLSLVFVYFLPESPAFYFKKNDVENARKSISWFKDRENELLVSYEMTIVLSKFTEKNKSLSWVCFKSKANKNALFLSLVFVIVTALNTCVFFRLYPLVTDLFVENLRRLGINSIIFILPILILIASIKILVTSRRKQLLITSYSLVTVSMILLSIFWNFVLFRLPGDDVEQMFTDWLFLLSFVMFSTSYLLSSYVVPHVLYFEIFSHETMSSCMSVLYGFGSLLILVLITICPYIQFIGFGTCLFLMSLFFITLVKVLIIYLPETKGEVFQKIRKKFRRIKNAQRSKKVSIFTIGDGEIDV